MAEKAIPTGLPGLDACAPVTPGQLLVLRSETGVGKTALALRFARAAASVDIRVVYAHTESRPDILQERILSAESGVPLSRLAAGDLTRDEVASLRRAATVLATSRCLNIWLAGFELRPDRLLREMIAWRGKGARVFFVDSLDGLELPVRPGDSMAGVLVGTVDQLAHAAQHLRMAVHLLIQKEPEDLPGLSHALGLADTVLELERAARKRGSATHRLLVYRDKERVGDLGLSLDGDHMEFSETALT